jgi:phytol kinase
LVVVLLSQRYNIFKAINDVKRKTWGDVLYALGIGLTATLTRDPWIFAVAILFMSLSDGMAGLVGVHYGKKSQYTVFGNKKSIAGTLAFILCSFAILIGIQTVHTLEISPLMFVILPFMAAALENLGSLGSDNILIPVLVVLALS